MVGEDAVQARRQDHPELVLPRAERGRDILVRALRSQVDLEVAYTQRKGHGVELARNAARDRFDLVVTLGGDGTKHYSDHCPISVTLAR